MREGAEPALHAVAGLGEKAGGRSDSGREAEHRHCQEQGVRRKKSFQALEGEDPAYQRVEEDDLIHGKNRQIRGQFPIKNQRHKS